MKDIFHLSFIAFGGEGERNKKYVAMYHHFSVSKVMLDYSGDDRSQCT